jgi:RNA polymerase sigma-70 factor (ECF subfamily)
MDDEAQVRQALNGNHRAFTQLVERYTPLVYAYIRARVRRPDVVPDLVQETFSRAWAQRHTLQDPARFGAWLFGIARNICNAYFRDQRNRATRTFTDVSRLDPRLDPPAPEGRPREDLEQLMAEVYRLPLLLRAPLLLRLFNPHLTYQQLAGLLNTTPEAVNRRLTRARNQLRRRLRV